MKFNSVIKTLAAAVFISSACFAQETSAVLIKQTEGFSHPESVVLDRANDFLYVSNMAEREPGDGFISRLNSDGSIETLNWITGLQDPKGLLVVKEKLYVTNNTQLIQIDTKEGKISKVWNVEGAVSLNDITLDAAGNILISDLGKGSLFMLPGNTGSLMMKDTPPGEVSEFLHSEELQRPNGVFAQMDHLYIASWGKNTDGNLLKMDLDTKEISPITTAGIGNLDGIQPAGKDHFYISDWATGKIYLAGKDGSLQEVLTSGRSAGDILYIPETKQLVLPMNIQNEIWWYQLE